MKSFGTALGAFVLLGAGAVMLTQCSSSSSGTESTFDGSGEASDAAVIEDCTDALAFTCPVAVPTIGASCNPPNACTSSSKTATACQYLCANGQQQFVASCPDGQWAVATVNDCSLDVDAGPDASAIDAGVDASDGG